MRLQTHTVYEGHLCLRVSGYKASDKKQRCLLRCLNENILTVLERRVNATRVQLSFNARQNIPHNHLSHFIFS